MRKKDILGKCLMYKGEKQCPFQPGSFEAEIWGAEVFCYQNNNLIDSSNADKSIENWMESFIGKWNPWEWEQVMEQYRNLKYGK